MNRATWCCYRAIRSWFRRRLKGDPFRVWLATLLVSWIAAGFGGLGPRVASAETRVIPSVSVTERYDSNVFFAPSASVPGLKRWDFVTAVTPMVQVVDKTREVETTLNLGGSGNVFVNNSKLNFFPRRSTAQSSWTGWLDNSFPA